MKQLMMYIQFFTKIPVPFEIPFDRQEFARGIFCLPIAGVLIGLFSGLFYWFGTLAYIPLLAPLLAITAEILITGAFHMDGLGDTADGLFSSRNPEQMLHIMRDSRMGTNGVLAIVIAFIFKLVLINALPQAWVFKMIVLAPALTKACMPILLYKAEYPREDGLGNLLIGKVNASASLATLLLGLFLSIFMVGRKGAIICLCTGLWIWGARKLSERKIGGITGDILGAAMETGEIIVYLTGVFTIAGEFSI